MKDDILGYRFGGTEEAYLVPVREASDPVEASRQKEWVEQHPIPTEFALHVRKATYTTRRPDSKLMIET